jgi:hypothetical protein
MDNQELLIPPPPSTEVHLEEEKVSIDTQPQYGKVFNLLKKAKTTVKKDILNFFNKKTTLNSTVTDESQQNIESSDKDPGETDIALAVDPATEDEVSILDQAQKDFALLERELDAIREEFPSLCTESYSDPEADIASLESLAGIETGEDRLAEASLLVDWKFIRSALITGNSLAIERAFGNGVWANWLDARIQARQYGNQDLTVDFIKNIHIALTRRTNPELGGQFRWGGIVGGDYTNVGQPASLTPDQIEGVESQKYLSFRRTAPEATEGFIVYPANTRDAITKYSLSAKATEIYVQNGSTTEALVQAMLSDTCDWYNEVRRSDSIPAVRLASELQQRLISIHPFGDYNGRLTRVMMQWSLENSGLAPALVEDFSNDLYMTPEKWAAEVEAGTERSRLINERKQEHADLGIHDFADLMNLDAERTFYKNIYQKISADLPTFSTESNLPHGEHDDFLEGFDQQYKRFREKFSASVQHEGHTIQQGGLIPETYISLCRAAQTPHLREYIRKRFFSEDVDIFRGGIAREPVDDNSLLRMFQTRIGISSDYLALQRQHIPALSTQPIQATYSIDSLVRYNALMSESFLGASGIPGNNPDALAEVISIHINDPYNSRLRESPFASTTFKTQNFYAKNEDLASTVNSTAGINNNLRIHSGIGIVGLYRESGEILGFNTVDGGGESEISGLNANFSYAGEQEASIAGGIDPCSIDTITVYDYDIQAGHFSEGESLVAVRRFEEGQETVEIVDRRDPTIVRRRKYQNNPDTLQFQLVDETEEVVPPSPRASALAEHLEEEESPEPIVEYNVNYDNYSEIPLELSSIDDSIKHDTTLEDLLGEKEDNKKLGEKNYTDLNEDIW